MGWLCSKGTEIQEGLTESGSHDKTCVLTEEEVGMQMDGGGEDEQQALHF